MAFKKGQIGYWAGKKRPPFSKKTIEKMRDRSMGDRNPAFGKHYLNSGFKKGHKDFVSREGRKQQSKKIGGNNHYFWKGGVGSENYKARGSEEYKLWRKSVFIKDGFICQKYRISGGKLVAHHINNFAEFSELRFALDNGITLSLKAHNEFHKLYGKRNNTREQLEEFLERK